MLFRVEFGKDFFELNPEAKAIEEFGRCTSRQMDYVALATDYKSPFRKLAIEDKKYQAAMVAGYKLKKDGKAPDTNTANLLNDKVGNVVAAIKRYKELMRDEDREVDLSIGKLIEDIRVLNSKENKTALEIEKAVNLTTGKLDKLLETRRKVREILELREEPPTTPNGTALSLEEGDDVVDEGTLSVLEKLNQGMI